MLGLALTAAIAGCGAGADRDPPFLPSSPEARAAVERTLSAWRDARPPLPDSFDSPGVRFVDTTRRPGQALRDFQIVGERGEPNARQFTVRLTLDPPADESTTLVRYNVFGRNPVWVFRLEDYERISHWEHEMNEAPGTGPGPKPAAPRAGAGDHNQPSTRTRRIP